MNQINKLTNVNALKLSHASVQTQKTDEKKSWTAQRESAFPNMRHRELRNGGSKFRTG